MHEFAIDGDDLPSDEAKEDLTDKYSTIEEEVDKKSRKLEKLVRKVNEAEGEISDLQREFQAERADMLDTIRQLARQIKLKEMVIDLFVPPDRAKTFEDRTRWEEDRDAWTLEPLEAALAAHPLMLVNVGVPDCGPCNLVSKKMRAAGKELRAKAPGVTLAQLTITTQVRVRVSNPNPNPDPGPGPNPDPDPDSYP